MPESIDAGRVFLDVGFDGKQIAKALTDPVKDAAKDVERQLSRNFGQGAQRAGQAMTRYLTPAAAALGLGFRKAFQEWDGGIDAIRTGTGKTGKELDRLGASMNRVAGTVTAGLGEVGQVIADLERRTNLTGAALEGLATQVLQLGQVGNAASVETVTRAFGDWSVATDHQAASLDTMFRASQQTGVPVERLLGLLTQYGAPLREFGFGMEDGAALLGKFEQEGVNTELVMGALRVALGKFARDQRDPQQALQETIDRINGAGTAAEANAIAFETFGARAGVDMARAIQEGRFAIGDLTDAIEDGTDTIGAAAEDATDLGDRLEMLANRAMGVVGPFGEIGMGLSGVAVLAGPVVKKFGEMSTAAGGFGGMLKNVGSFLTGPWGIALGVGGAALAGFIIAQQQATKEANTMADALIAAAGDDVIDQVNALRDALNDPEQQGPSGLERWLIGLGLTGGHALGVVDANAEVLTGRLEELSTALLGDNDALLAHIGLYGDWHYWQRQGINDTDAVTLATQVWTRATELGVDMQQQGSLATQAFALRLGDLASASYASMGAAIAAAGAAAEMAQGLNLTAEQVESLGGAFTSFVDPMNAWSQAQSDAQDEAREWAEGQVAAGLMAEESVTDYVDSVLPTFGRWKDELKEQVVAQENWATNMSLLAGRVSEDTLSELAAMGPEAASLVDEMVHQSDAELAEVDDLFTRRAESAGEGFAAGLVSTQADINRVAAEFGQGAVDQINGALTSGLIDAADASWGYTEALRTGVNPLLLALGHSGISPVPRDQTVGFINQVDRPYAQGGHVDGPNVNRDVVRALLTPDEWVINRDVSRRVGPWRMGLLNAGKATVVPFNSGGQVPSDEDYATSGTLLPGGFADPSDVPAAPGFGAAGAWAFDPARATAAEARAAVVAFVEKYGGGTRPPLGSGGFTRGGGGGPAGQYTAGMMLAHALAASMGFTSIGGYRAQGSVATSDHPKHRAWDFMLPGGQGAEQPGWRLATQHIRRSTEFGTKYLIFSDLINSGGGWRPYHHPKNPGDRNPTLAHRDHLHASYFAKGGIVTDPTLAVLGEKTAEAVIPLDRAIDVNILDVAPGAYSDILPPTTAEQHAGQFGLVTPPVGPPSGPFNLGPMLTNPRMEEAAENQAAAALAAASGADLIGMLQDLQAETFEWSDEWVDLGHQIDAAVSATADNLTDLLGEYDRVTEQMARQAQQAAEQMRAEDKRFAEAAAQEAQRYAQQVTDARTQAAAQEAQLIDQRTKGLDAAVRLDQRLQASWGSSAKALTANINQQADAYRQQRELLFGLRARGLSQDVIASLGLEAGPQALGQLQALMRSDDAGLAGLNAAYAGRQAQIGLTVGREVSERAGGLGGSLAAVDAGLASQLLDLQRTHQADADKLITDHLDAVALLGEQQAAAMAALQEQMLQIGQDTGRDYSEAQRDAMLSGIPGLVAAAQAQQAAIAAAGNFQPQDSVTLYKGGDEHVGNITLNVPLDGHVLASTTAQIWQDRNRRLHVRAGR